MPPGAALGGGHRRGGPEDGPPICESPGRGLSQVRRPRIIDRYLAKIEGVGGPLPRQGPRPMWCASGWSRWGSAAMSGPPAARSPKQRRRGGPGGGARIGRACVPFDPESKGSEATVRIAKADLVPTEANLRTEYDSATRSSPSSGQRSWCHRTGRKRAWCEATAAFGP